MACDSPFYVTPKGAVQSVPVPCGRCPPCKKRRVDSWVFRLMQQEKVSDSAHFITLTYGPHSIPISDNGFMTLDKQAFPNFMKRLRKLCPGAVLKYYACGEYGSKNRRPHYHAIVFNVPRDSLFFDAWTLDGTPIGAVHVGNVSGNSVAYTMKYIDKSSFRASHGRDDRLPEFALMSKGLGANYVTPAVKRFHHSDYSRLYCTVDGGHKIAMPRYYRERIYVDDDSGYQRSLIQAAMLEKESDLRAYHAKYFSLSPDFSFEAFLDSQKMARYKSFYANQKSRSL